MLNRTDIKRQMENENVSNDTIVEAVNAGTITSDEMHLWYEAGLVIDTYYSPAVLSKFTKEIVDMYNGFRRV